MGTANTNGFQTLMAWHWLLAIAGFVVSGWLYVQGDPGLPASLGIVALVAWSSSAVYVGLHIDRHSHDSLFLLRQVHFAMKWLSGIACGASLLGGLYCGLVLVIDPPYGWDGLGYAIGLVLLPLLSVPCGVVFWITGKAVRYANRLLDLSLQNG